MLRVPACLSLTPLLLAIVMSRPQSGQDATCLAFVTTNLAKGNGNWYTYVTFANKRVTFRAGDTLAYTILLDPANPMPKGGIDIKFDRGDDFRELGIVDQNGIRGHGDGELPQAIGKWYTRHFPMDAVAGRTATAWQMDEEGDKDGQYCQFLRDLVVEHKDGSKEVVYGGGAIPMMDVESHNGYTENPSLVQVPVDLVTNDTKAAVQKAVNLGKQQQKVASIQHDLDFVRKFLKRNPNPELQVHLDEAESMLTKMQSEEVGPDTIEQILHTAQHAMSHAHPEMEKYTGHLVGHAHIDLQWLWEWQEGMVAAYDTFNQATKFMDEFPGFTFSQSSSCLYETIQENWPDLFKKIQQKVKAGQWEIVGGRVCEGDTNMISPESHIRQFLYGQTYFRENFGKTATVGWEPDTFGHTIQMPQILKLGGCTSYYFCRGGKGKPLFWWEGLDGTKMLSFDEPASGSWYNSDLSYKQFQEMLDFQDNTGSKDMLWVYGIGNHGGGPSREYIETALSWMKDPAKPKVKFSTATQFFDKLRTYDLTKIPVVNQELNPVFDGCYTSHAEVKQLNRHAEYTTGSAEAVATVASLFGYAYPHEAFKQNWTDICFNHHHDTLPGSGIHAPYERTKTVLGRVLADDRDIETRALETLSIRQTPYADGISLMVFNPSGWARSGMVRTWLVTSGWSGRGLDTKNCVADDPTGKSVPVKELDPISHLAEFEATDVPAFGWKVFHIHNGPQQGRSLPSHIQAIPHDPSDDPSFESGLDLVNDRLGIAFNKETGAVTRIREVSAGTRTMDFVGTFGLPELNTEHDDGMSAWVLGKVQNVQNCPVVSHGSGPGWVSFTHSIPWGGTKTGESTLKQTFHLEGREIIVDVDCNWQAVGTSEYGAPLLRVAFDTGLRNPTATYEVPFGALTRPTDGQECAALNWADVSDGNNGIAVLNDSKSGYSCQGNVLRLSMIRSSTGPDPDPNPGHFHWRYAIVPHKGDYRTASLPRLGDEFQAPLMTATVPFDGHGNAPRQWSLLGVSDLNVLVTGVKRAEGSDDLIVHLYDAGGQGAKGSLHVNVPVAGASSVNFIEDKLGDAKPVSDSIPLALHKFEIQCFRLKLNKKQATDSGGRPR